MTTNAPMTIEQLNEAFEFLEDWEDRYRFIMDLGKKLPPMPDSERTKENLVHGCQSTVWVSAQSPGGVGAPVHLHADSDSDLVKGLAAMVVIMLSGKGAAEIATCDLEASFDRLGLHEHLSPTRSNGLHGMVRQVKSRAAAIAAA
ncbi:MAG: SufE family protein [Phycisphaerales bacterium]|nr:SufE family protein [Phycisphaerales bacterium]